MLCDRIKELRLSQGLTQAQFAKRLYVTSGAVSQWETGQTRPDTDRLIKIAVEFGVPLSTLVDIEDEKIAEQTKEKEIRDRAVVLRVTRLEERFINEFRQLNKEGQKYIIQTLAIAKHAYSQSDDVSNMGIA